MAANHDNPTVKMPPLENWASQTFAYGFLLDRSASLDYSGNAAPNQSGRTGFDKPQPDDLHLLNLNPQDISLDEPFATSVRPSQGGGKYVESRGMVMKSGSIRGTTGFMPPRAPYAQHMVGPSFNEATAQDILNGGYEKRTGFFEFYRLRRLFRQFGLERLEGKAVQMHWLDFKGDEFWMIEPKRFHMSRTRFAYTYDIAFDCLQPSQLRIAADSQGMDKGLRVPLQTLLNPLQSVMDATTRSAFSRIMSLSRNAKQFVQQFTIGVLTLKIQSIISKVTAIQSFFADVAAIRRAVLDVPLSLYKQLYSAVVGLQEAFYDITPTAFKADLNEFSMEMRFLTEGLITHHLKRYGSTPGHAFTEENNKYTTQRATLGTKTSFMMETEGSTGSPLVNPFVGSSGLQLIGNIEQMAATTAMRAEDILGGETIFDIAQRLLGDANRYIDLVVINRLQPPFIVSNPLDKPPGTLAWTEKIMVPSSDDDASLSTAAPIASNVPAFTTTIVAASSTELTYDLTLLSFAHREEMWVGFTVEFLDGPAVGEKRVITMSTDAGILTVNRAYAAPPVNGNTFTVQLVLFTPRQAATPETRAFGRDIMGVFTKTNGLIDGTIDIMLNPRKDLATVQGVENLEQAVALCLSTPRGSNKLNPFYGTGSVVGRPFEPNIVAMNVFYVRQSLLQDPRISSVEQPKIIFDGGKMYFTVYVRPVRVQRTLFFRIPL